MKEKCYSLVEYLGYSNFFYDIQVGCDYEGPVIFQRDTMYTYAFPLFFALVPSSASSHVSRIVPSHRDILRVDSRPATDTRVFLAHCPRLSPDPGSRTVLLCALC